MTSDSALLTQYARTGSEAAFAEIAARYRALVYRTCRRELDSDPQAEDAAQVVFLLLARKARTLRPGPSLAGWLFRTAVFVAKDVRKQETRRQRREQIVMTGLTQTYPAPPPEDDLLTPLLNPALASLRPADRDVVLLRCFQGLSLAETGAALGVSEDAARMRCARALEKLRHYLTAHGAAATSVSVAAFLTAEAARPIPARAAEALPSPNVLLLSKGVSHTMKVIKLKYAALAATVLVGGVAAVSLKAAQTTTLRVSTPHTPLTYVINPQSSLKQIVPASAVPTGQSESVQTIVLQHRVPGDIVKSQHWDQFSKLPAGASKIEAVPAKNALVVTATPAGFATVEEIVKRLDVAPRQITIQAAFVHASESELKASGIKFDFVPMNQPTTGAASAPAFAQYASGSLAIQLLQFVTRRGSVNQMPDITTSENTNAFVNFSTTLPSGQTKSTETSVTPRINSDGSLTLALHLVLSDNTNKREISVLRTIKNHDTIVMVLPPVASSAKGDSLLLFVTPTVK